MGRSKVEESAYQQGWRDGEYAAYKQLTKREGSLQLARDLVIAGKANDIVAEAERLFQYMITPQVNESLGGKG